MTKELFPAFNMLQNENSETFISVDTKSMQLKKTKYPRKKNGVYLWIALSNYFLNTMQLTIN